MVTRPNYLEMQSWGRRPKSKRHRRQAMLSWLGPTILFLSAVMIIGFTFFTIDLMVNSNEFIDESGRAPTVLDAVPFATGSMFFSAWLLGLAFCVLIPFLLENRFSNARMIQMNLPDYKLAGFNANDMLKGLAAPQLRGVHLFFYVYGLATSVLLLVSAGRADGIFVAFVLSSVVMGLINLFAGSYFSLALWSKNSSKGERAFMIGLFTLSPLFGFCATVPLAIILSFLIRGAAFLLVPLATITPIVVAIKAWINAIRRIDTPPTEDDLAFLPASPTKAEEARSITDASSRI